MLRRYHQPAINNTGTAVAIAPAKNSRQEFFRHATIEMVNAVTGNKPNALVLVSAAKPKIIPSGSQRPIENENFRPPAPCSSRKRLIINNSDNEHNSIVKLS